MSYISLGEKQLKPLLKFAFLYVGDIEEAKAILQKSIKKNTKMAHSKMDEKEETRHLTEEVLRQCHRYSKSFAYQKDEMLKTLGIKWYDHAEISWRAINKLPKRMREVAISHYILQLTHAEVAKTLHLPPGHVTSYLNKANIKLKIYSEENERNFIQHLNKDLEIIENLNWSTFLQSTQPQQNSKKVSYIIWGLATLLMASIFITTVVMKDKGENDVSEQHLPTDNSEPQNDSDGAIANKTDSTIDGDNENPIINTSFEPIVLEDISFKLAAYEEFYRQPNFSSAKEAKKRAADRLYRYISTIEFANERNIYLSESEQRALERDNLSMVNSLKYFPTDEKYLNNVLVEFKITEDQYIEYFVNLENEYFAYEMKIYDLNINREALELKLYVEKTPAAFYERAGITAKEAKEIEKTWEQIEIEEVTERQFNLPFDLTGSYMHIIQLENGQYIFENPGFFGLYSTKYGSFLERYVFARNPMTVNRTSLDDMIAYLENFDTDYEPNKQLARELVEVYKLLKQSIEWDLD